MRHSHRNVSIVKAQSNVSTFFYTCYDCYQLYDETKNQEYILTTPSEYPITSPPPSPDKPTSLNDYPS